MIVAARWLRHTFSCQCALVKAHKIDICYCLYDDDGDDNVVNGGQLPFIARLFFEKP